MRKLYACSTIQQDILNMCSVFRHFQVKWPLFSQTEQLSFVCLVL